MARSGVESVRTVFNWALAQPEPGVTDFTYTDRLVGLAASHGIDLVPVVRTTPAWAKRDPVVRGLAAAEPVRLRRVPAALIGRYGPKGSYWVEHPELPKLPVRVWQVWNEPHLNLWWNTDGRSPNAWAREYAALLKTAKAAIDAADPGATVVLAALADYAWKHLTRLNHFKIGRYYDVAAINLFTARPASVFRGVRYFRRAMRRGGAAAQAGVADRGDLAGRQGQGLAPAGRLAARLVHDRPGHGRSRRATSTSSRPSTAASCASGEWSGTRGRRPTRTTTCSTTPAWSASRAGNTSSGRRSTPTPRARAATRAAGRARWASAASGLGARTALRAARPPPASGSAASRMARTTTTRRAPAATTWATLPASMPPIANQGTSPPRSAA